LRPLLIQVLLRLAQEPGAPITQKQLINDVWARKIVNDEVLSRAIAELRLALGDDSREPRYIETLPKVGYRLVAAVSNAVSEPKPANAGPSTPAAPDVATRPVAPVSRRRPWSRWLAPVGAGLLVIALVALWVAQRPGETAPNTDLTTQLNTATPLASDPALELAPRFSPDGRQVIYVRRTAEQSEIVIQAVASGERRVVVHSAGILASPMFAGGDRRIAYWRQTEGGCAIVARDLAGGTEKELLDCTLRPQTPTPTSLPCCASGASRPSSGRSSPVPPTTTCSSSPSP
jgi:DNA-binding winged helix-turn-helix (wHTH) protein